MSNPSCQAGFSVNGEIRGPNPEVTHPLTGHIEGVAAHRDERCSAAWANSVKMRSCIAASFVSQLRPSFTETTASTSCWEELVLATTRDSWLASAPCLLAGEG